MWLKDHCGLHSEKSFKNVAQDLPLVIVFKFRVNGVEYVCILLKQTAVAL